MGQNGDRVIDWLKRMPSESEVDAEIATVERELAVLRHVQALRRGKTICRNCGREFRPQLQRDGSLQAFCRNRNCQGTGARTLIGGN